MRVLLQRVSQASVEVAGETVGQCGAGLLLLVGIGPDDDQATLLRMADKLLNLRIFPDDAGKMNLSLLDVEGQILAVSQFTLFADSRKGRRPSFVGAAPPEQASAMFDEFVALLKQGGAGKVETGRFGAHMEVSLVNDGPVTIWLDSEDWG
jgi:D-tyrosyl-tRNA(Tyr) deacylase